MSLVSLFNQGFSYSSASSSTGVPSAPNASSPSRAPASRPSAPQTADSIAADDEADTTYTPAYVRSAANASGAPPARLALPDDTPKPAAKSETANALADTQRRFSDLMARLDASSQKPTEPSAAKPTAGAPASSPEPASASAARLKTVIAAYATNYAPDRIATFSV